MDARTMMELLGSEGEVSRCIQIFAVSKLIEALQMQIRTLRSLKVTFPEIRTVVVEN